MRGFKVWHKKELRWLKDSEFKINADGSVATYGIYTARESLVRCDGTGLLDKNGKEIYEGDIVKWGHNINTVGEGMGVCFDGGFEEGQGDVTITPLGISFGKDKMLWDCEGYFECPLDENIGELEVIGNIFETPELKGG
jgi:uncharacterized phage protein (TIGR01671 family)